MINLSKCNSCGADIIWAVSREGNRMPINPDPVVNGNVILTERSGNQPPIATVLKKSQQDDLLLALEPRYVSHFATCPQSKQWRKTDNPKFNAQKSAAKRDQAMEQVEQSAEEEWKEVAYDTVIEVARVRQTFTADDVQEKLDKKPVHTHELRALGPVMLRAARDHVIEDSGTFTRTTQVKCHRMPRRIWRSLINGHEI